MELNLEKVNWRVDWITRRYVSENRAMLETPSKMTPGNLAVASTYCDSWINPFAEELTRRAGNHEKYLFACHLNNMDWVRKAVTNAGKAFGHFMF